MVVTNKKNKRKLKKKYSIISFIQTKMAVVPEVVLVEVVVEVVLVDVVVA